MGIINFFKVHIFKLGILATIKYEDEEFEKINKYVKYGTKIESNFNKPGFDTFFKLITDSDAVFDLAITKDKFPQKKYTFYAEFRKKKILLNVVDLNGKTSKIEGFYDDEIPYPKILKKIGIRFEGYFLDRKYKEEFKLKKFPTENKTLFKKETEIKYPIRYSGFNLGENNKKNPNYITYKQEVLLLSPSLPGHNFVGWYDNPKFKNNPISKLLKVDYDVYLYAKFDVNSYKVTFDTKSDQKIQSKTYYYNEKISINDKPKNIKGFTFGGWLFKNNYLNYRTMPAHDLELTASWNPIEYNIELNLNYKNKIKNVTYNRLIDEYQLERVQRKGYNFVGWYMDKSLEGPRIYKVRTEMMKNISLFAKWEIKRYDVKLFDRGKLVKTYKIQEGMKVDVSDLKLKRDGWVFNGWSISESKFQEYDFKKGIFTETFLYSNWGQYKKITSNDCKIWTHNNNIVVKFNLLNSCDIMKLEYVTLLVNIRVKARTVEEEDFYFDNSIENSNVWTTDRNLISNSSMKARLNKQVKSKDLKNFSINIHKDKLMYYFYGNHSNVLSVLLFKDKEVIFSKEFSFENTSNLILNNNLNKMNSAVENAIKYILYSQYKINDNLILSQKQKDLLNDFQKNKLESNELIDLDNLINNISSNNIIQLHTKILDVMKKSISVTAIASDIRETFIRFLLMNVSFKEKALIELEVFSSNLGFDYEETIGKVSSNLKDSNIPLNMYIFGIYDNFSNSEKLEKINKVYLDFSKKIISSNKQISNKAKEVIKFLAAERKKMEV